MRRPTISRVRLCAGGCAAPVAPPHRERDIWLGLSARTFTTGEPWTRSNTTQIYYGADQTQGRCKNLSTYSLFLKLKYHPPPDPCQIIVSKCYWVMTESTVDPESPSSEDIIEKFRKCWIASTANNNLTLHGFRRFKTTHLLDLRFLENKIADMDHIICQAGLSLGLNPSFTDRLGLKHGKRDANIPNISDTITREFVLEL
ncbi:hypothetical protein K491DRAFT_741861 [Lophiostoma macrostomum CBS 122681]|uniref:Uncharacterized protein n=1 Tax=Lophiostoma macrostomum CBS 122681 TaxID=1314788 RepID=A0A6A6SJQ0_9PLEO|nr:hypothetical protein K491DRAFT_741861 [Lophiostoma macrostomum CBS 122681]